MANFSTDFIRLRSITDDSKQTGLSVSLWQSGIKIANLTQNAGIAWQYDFPVAIINGTYDLYINDLPAKINGVQIEVAVVRDGNVAVGKEW